MKQILSRKQRRAIAWENMSETHYNRHCQGAVRRITNADFHWYLAMANSYLFTYRDIASRLDMTYAEAKVHARNVIGAARAARLDVGCVIPG
jgi:hypothetical protein